MRAEPGDSVKVDEPIAQIETDKVLFWSNILVFVTDLLCLLLDQAYLIPK